MTVSTTGSSAQFYPNGATTHFPFRFRFFQNSDLKVFWQDLTGNIELLRLNSDYTVQGAGAEDGGAIDTTGVPLPNGTLVVSRVMVATQLTSFRNQGEFFAEIHEDAFDRLIMLVQQTIDSQARGLTIPPSDPLDINLELPSSVTRAGMLLAFDERGQPAASNLTLAQLEQQPALALAAAQASADSAVASGVSAASALASAVNSSDSATLSQMWASNPEDTPVVAGLYSAFHWARKALASAQAAAATLAGAVMKTGAQTMAGPLTVTNGFVGIPLSKEYSSPEQVITPAGGQVLPHGLPSIPRLLISNLICKTAELGYTAGEIVGVSSNPDYAYSLGVSVVPDASNVMYRYGSQAGVFFILHKVTGSVSLITPANWRLVIRAWA